MQESQDNFSRIVITGGPCAGKTSVLSYLQQELAEHQVSAVTVPESARPLIAAGLGPSVIGALEFQKRIIAVQMAQEELYSSIVQKSFNPVQKAVLLCDRGTMDSRAYIDEDSFNLVLEEGGWNIPSLRDARYEAVIHLVSAARGAEAFYVRDTERKETVDEALVLDERTQHAWVGHPHLSVIGNETDFATKKRKVLGTILHHLGMPVPLEIEKKFLIEASSLSSLPLHASRVLIEQIYFPETEEGIEERIRRRSQGAHSVCYRTRKRVVGAGVREEREWQVPLHEFTHGFRSVKGGGFIRKYRWCFLHEGQYFEVDDFSPMREDGLCIAEIELTDQESQVRMPPWMNVIKEVTDDPRYSNRALALTFV
jgi:CYTH domain-containing protein/predicted ATPase